MTTPESSGNLTIRGGRVYDPANGIDGAVRDIHIAAGRIVSSLPEGVSARVIKANGLVVMPGGVDIHCHIASSAVNRARAMQGEEHATHVHHACDHGHGHMRSGSGHLTPSTFTTGHRYAALGYTTALEAAVAPSFARQTRLELQDTPNIDAAYLLLLANHERVIELLSSGDRAGVTAFISQMLSRTGAYGIKVVNPGGVASWRRSAQQQTVATIDDAVAGTKVTGRHILEAMADAAEALGLPHPPHVHCNRLGLPGNVETTLATLDALKGRRVHVTHLQFHAYGCSKSGDATSAASRLADYINANPNVTADVGQVVFGEAFTLTADTPLEHTLWQLTGNRYQSVEAELETGCGLMPIEYKDKHYLHSLQWAIGLELMLSVSEPWRMLLSTDHPNGGSFLSYPSIIASLMNRTIRDEQMSKAHARAMRNSRLADLDREMSLSEIAVLLSAGPARVLGMTHKGHLGEGADADVVLYHDNTADPQQMFESPRYVIKGGQVLVDDGQLRMSVPGRHMRARVTADPRGRGILDDWFAKRGSYDVRQFGLCDFELATMPEIAGRI